MCDEGGCPDTRGLMREALGLILMTRQQIKTEKGGNSKGLKTFVCGTFVNYKKTVKQCVFLHLYIMKFCIRHVITHST